MITDSNSSRKDTDFIAAGGPQGHSWNVIRSQGDELLFKHAGESGAKIFDTTKVNSVKFEPVPVSASGSSSSALPSPGRPVSATWSRKDGSSGTISFQYFIDATGRQGLLSTKYLKNRSYNQGLKNIANWAYWKGAGAYGVGTKKQGSPYFEALKGW
jgi:flavine halogenase